ncbi:toll/interleukin-1 receptor domain-containing protein [Methylobacter sp. sgz302048]|jgi:hypothetical protein|uniref:toll/interleukin-1 receptor domain-containing protein n=1 Tax=Methylobacter sp. sgz302048 TaxID=3455945 RepID=UPI003FA0D326
MYNLFVSGRDEAWEGEPYLLEIDRCVREYTDNELTVRFGNLDAVNVNELRRLPCIFAYESGCRKDPKFGVLRNVAIRQQVAKIEYDIIVLDQFLTEADLREDGLAFDLDISKWEMNRTHWAVKDVNLAKELHVRGIVLPHWARSATKAVDITKHTFDVALSFPGETRDYVEPVAAELERIIGPNSYFYDNNYVSQLARPSLDSLLQDIYRNRSKLVVVFLCSDYQEKEWCGIEFRAIKEIMMEREHGKVMFVKMDDGQVDGVFKTDGYIDGRKFSPADVARFIQERVDLLQNET